MVWFEGDEVGCDRLGRIVLGVSGDWGCVLRVRDCAINM